MLASYWIASLRESQRVGRSRPSARSQVTVAHVHGGCAARRANGIRSEKNQKAHAAASAVAKTGRSASSAQLVATRANEAIQ